MSDPTPHTPESAPASTPVSQSDIPAQEIEQGKVLAVISYLIPIVAVVPLVQKDNRFSLFHAKQVLTLIIFVLPCAILSGLLTGLIIGCFLLPVVALANLALVIMGIMNVVNNQAKPLPLIGHFAEKWFAGIQATPKA